MYICNNIYQPLPQNSNMALGGYPYGYPPMLPQQANPFNSPFPNPQPSIMPMEVTMKDGTTMNMNATTQPVSGYIQGGATVSQGGFNPVTGMTTPPMVAQGGFNPYQQYNNYYAPPQPQQGFGVYDPAVNRQPFMGMGIYSPFNTMVNPYGQNQFNTSLQEFLYNEDVSSMNVTGLLEHIVLSDEEREKIDHNRSYVIGYDYYGNPIYNNGYGSYNASQERQKQLEEARLHHQKHFTMLSRIVHHYYNEEFDEEATMKRFDPIPPQPQSQGQKIFNYYSATDEEKMNYQRDMMYQQSLDLERRLQENERINKYYDHQKEIAFRKIKESHDRMIGVNPGEHYNLQTYLDNGYKLKVNLAHSKAKSERRNGTNKYSRNDFRRNLSMTTNSNIPITSKDDEYVSIEDIMKGVYERNKSAAMGGRPLMFSGGVMAQHQQPQIPAPGSEQEAHQFFLQAMQNKKELDDINRAGVS